MIEDIGQSLHEDPAGTTLEYLCNDSNVGIIPRIKPQTSQQMKQFRRTEQMFMARASDPRPFVSGPFSPKEIDLAKLISHINPSKFSDRMKNPYSDKKFGNQLFLQNIADPSKSEGVSPFKNESSAGHVIGKKNHATHTKFASTQALEYPSKIRTRAEKNCVVTSQPGSPKAGAQRTNIKFDSPVTQNIFKHKSTGGKVVGKSGKGLFPNQAISSTGLSAKFPDYTYVGDPKVKSRSNYMALL